ncbi:MAG: hypothetical protein QM736_27015 [Vicinamibacterales bacterium]
MGRVLRRSTQAVAVAALAAMAAAPFLLLSTHPAVVSGEQLTPDLVFHAQQLIREHNPRRMRGGELRVAEVDGSDVNLMASYAASRYGWALAVDVRDGAADVQASVPVGVAPLRRYLNIAAVVPAASGVPQATDVRVGRVSVPDAIANWAIRRAVRHFYPEGSEELASDTIRSVAMQQGRLRVEYRWRTDTADRMRALAVSTEEADRLRAYHERLVSVVRDLPSQHRSMVDLVSPLMLLARERSEAGGDPVVENRAAILTATFYVNDIGMAAVVADAEQWPKARRRIFLLRGRGDLTMHFLVSAVLTTTTGTPLSNIVGLSKEIQDSRGGSGFSFSDLAADHAGTAFGAMAVGSARLLQERIATGLAEADLMPEIDGLVENMPEPVFNERFGGVGSREYQSVLDEIDRRVAACRLYQR